VDHTDLVAHPHEGRTDLSRDAVFHVHLKAFIPPEAGRLYGLLRAHSEEHHIVDDLDQALGLAVSAWSPEGETQGAVLPEGHHGSKGVIGALSGSHLVGMTLLHGEEGSPVLEKHPRLSLHQPRSEAGIEALDPAHCVSPLVYGREVHGISVVVGFPIPRPQSHLILTGYPSFHLYSSPILVHELCPARKAVRVQKAIQREIGHLRIGDPTIPIGESQLLQLEEGMEVRGGVVPHILQGMLLRHPRVHELGNPLAVGRHHEELVAVITPRQRLHPGGGMVGKVFRPKVSPLDLQKSGDGLGHVALVESRLSVSGDAFEGPGQIGVLEKTPYCGRGARWKVECLACSVQGTALLIEILSQPGRNGESLTGIPDGGSQEF